MASTSSFLENFEDPADCLTSLITGCLDDPSKSTLDKRRLSHRWRLSGTFLNRILINKFSLLRSYYAYIHSIIITLFILVVNIL